MVQKLEVDFKILEIVNIVWGLHHNIFYGINLNITFDVTVIICNYIHIEKNMMQVVRLTEFVLFYVLVNILFNTVSLEFVVLCC
jgi:hypothetical protein